MLQLNCYKLLLLQNLWSVVNNRFLVVLSLCTVYWLVGLECTQLQHAWDKNCSLEIFGLQCKSYSYCLRNIVETQKHFCCVGSIKASLSACWIVVKFLLWFLSLEDNYMVYFSALLFAASQAFTVACVFLLHSGFTHNVLMVKSDNLM